jgi:hypothetical protein
MSNCSNTDPEVAQWWMDSWAQFDQSGYPGISQRPYTYKFWMSDTTHASSTHGPQVLLYEGRSELEAAQTFINEVRNGGLRQDFLSTKIAQRDPNAKDEYDQWRRKEASFYVSTAVNLYLGALGFINEGADFVLTTNDVINGDWFAAIGYLPLVSNSMVKIVDRKSGKTFILDIKQLDKLREVAKNGDQETALKRVGKELENSNAVSPTIAGGKWTAVNEALSASARAYQKQIRVRVRESYVVNGVKFGGINAGGLIDAKGPGYAHS